MTAGEFQGGSNQGARRHPPTSFTAEWIVERVSQYVGQKHWLIEELP